MVAVGGVSPPRHRPGLGLSHPASSSVGSRSASVLVGMAALPLAVCGDGSLALGRVQWKGAER